MSFGEYAREHSVRVADAKIATTRLSRGFIMKVKKKHVQKIMEKFKLSHFNGWSVQWSNDYDWTGDIVRFFVDIKLHGIYFRMKWTEGIVECKAYVSKSDRVLDKNAIGEIRFFSSQKQNKMLLKKVEKLYRKWSKNLPPYKMPSYSMV